ncbi:MAG TPA: zinc-regulated TonB-dependent outer membrane receptor [Candidatus Brocadiia bacterium]|nr:zinc-regulated TonB-dependent outer membrane receptor [Candidatus Brocadiia bacterium]
MLRIAALLTLAGLLASATPALAQAASPQDVQTLREEIRALKNQMDRQAKEHEAQLKALQDRLDAAAKAAPQTPAPASPAAAPAAAAPGQEPRYELSSQLASMRSELRPPAAQAPSFMDRVESGLASLNPEASVIIDTYYYRSQTDKSGVSIKDIYESMSGFGHSHGDEDHEHEGMDEGFNLRHLEIYLGASVDPYFKAYAITAIESEGAEIEEAVIQTTCLPGGFQAKVGKFFSDFGRINAQHSHEWDFVDQPLIYKLTLGEHGLNDKGAQLSWLAPTPFHLLAGVELFQGDNEVSFNYIGDAPLPSRAGPRLAVGWLKAAPNLSGPHAMQFGVFGASGLQQEAHDGNGDGDEDHWLSGPSSFVGGDFVYKFDSTQPHGHGDFIFQTEYMYRMESLRVKKHDLAPDLEGEQLKKNQDGLYAQAVYGFQPRWRAGLRADLVGLTNEVRYPDGGKEDPGASYRLTGMIDFTPSEFSRLRLQVNRGEYETSSGRQGAWEFMLQLMVSIGAHGAHKF